MVGRMNERLDAIDRQLLSLLQANPLHLQASHLSFQEYHTACALCAGAPLPAGALPWQWTAWWANVLRIGEAQGAAFQAGLLRAAGVGESLKLSRHLAKGPTALRAVLLLAEKVSHLDLSLNDLGATGVAEVAGALAFMPVLTTLNLAGNSIGVEGAKAIADSLKSGMAVLNNFPNASGTLRRTPLWLRTHANSWYTATQGRRRSGALHTQLLRSHLPS